MSSRASSVTVSNGPLAIVCGGGSLPFAVAEAALRGGRRVVLFPLRGAADAARVAEYPHHWLRVGGPGRFIRAARAEGCSDVVFIGTLVRPRISELWPDWLMLRSLPQVFRLFRGGDNHLLSGIATFFEEKGFRVLGADQVAPEILMPKGALGRLLPNDRDKADIATGFSLLSATGPFDVGQAVVVSSNRILAVEAADGTDAMLAHVAEMRRAGRIRTPAGEGVLVKSAKPGQDRRVDLPSIGPRTVESVAAAGLAGIAVAANSAIVAEGERIAATADRLKIFVVGTEAEGTGG